MRSFLSDESIRRHREYREMLKRNYSYYQNGIPELSSVSPAELSRRKYREKEKIVALYNELKLHEIFFASFRDDGEEHLSDLSPSMLASFRYRLYDACMNAGGGCVTVKRRGKEIRIEEVRDFYTSDADLAIDMCEHAYFLDYGFDKTSYVVSLIPRLRMSLLSSE